MIDFTYESNKMQNIEMWFSELKGSDFTFSPRGAGYPANFSDWIQLKEQNWAKVYEGSELISWDRITEEEPVHMSIR